MAGIKGQGVSIDRHRYRSKDLLTAIRRVMGMKVEVSEEAVELAKKYFAKSDAISFADIVAVKLFDMGIAGNVRALECIARMDGLEKKNLEKIEDKTVEKVKERAKAMFGSMVGLNG